MVICPTEVKKVSEGIYFLEMNNKISNASLKRKGKPLTAKGNVRAVIDKVEDYRYVIKLFNGEIKSGTIFYVD